MPPYAESSALKEQQQQQQQQQQQLAEAEATAAVTRRRNEDDPTVPTLPVRSLDSLKPNEICIDGIIYTLFDFDHPGGEQIHLFGGNDVTVQYKMIHPRHDNHNNTNKHLAKMTKVGKIPDYQCEYQFNTPFEREIKQEVFNIVKQGKEFGTPGYLTRALLYLAVYGTCLFFWITRGSSLPLALIWGLSHASIGLNVQHDANHGAAGNPRRTMGLWINNVFGFGADMIGGSKWLWMEQHWTHHAYTNGERDPDKHSAEPMVIFEDYPLGHPMRKWHHRLQALFVLPILSMYWLSMLLSVDVVTLQHAGAKTAGKMHFDNHFVRTRTRYALFSRFLYVTLVVLPPFFYHHPLTAFYHLMLMGAFGSAIISCLFVVSHNFEGAKRLTTAEEQRQQQAETNNSSINEKMCWFKTQVETSSTYGGFLSGCLTGGLNFQIEHHLFPRMSSAWYPYIAPKVREICAKHGVHYTYYPWIWQNLVSTIKFIHFTGTGTKHKQIQKPTRLMRYMVASALLGIYTAIVTAMMQQAEGDGFDNHNITVIGVLAFLFTVPVMRVFLNAFAPTIDMNALMTEAVDLETMAYYLVGGYTLWKVTSAAAAIF